MMLKGPKRLLMVSCFLSLIRIRLCGGYLLLLCLAVTKAYKTLENNESYRKCLEVVQEAKDRVLQMVVAY